MKSEDTIRKGIKQLVLVIETEEDADERTILREKILALSWVLGTSPNLIVDRFLDERIRLLLGLDDK